MCYIFFKGVFVEMDNHELILQQASQKLKYGNEVLTVEGSYRGSCSGAISHIIFGGCC